LERQEFRDPHSGAAAENEHGAVTPAVATAKMAQSEA
jgi:hypothetical protein